MERNKNGINELDFRKKFERTEEGPLGINTDCINKLIEACKVAEKSNSKEIVYFLEHFDKIDKVRSNMVFFTSTDSGYMYNASALSLASDIDILGVTHELGHVLNGIKNHKEDPSNPLKSKVDAPDEFKSLLAEAWKNCRTEENVEYFRNYIEHICKDNNITKAEKGPISDILSAIIGDRGLYIRSKENLCIFPSTHEDFYSDNLTEEEIINKKFDEIYANIFAMKANNCEEELQVLNKLLGNDFMQFFNKEIAKSVEIFSKQIGENDLKKFLFMDEIKYQKTNENIVETEDKEDKMKEYEIKEER